MKRQNSFNLLGVLCLFCLTWVSSAAWASQNFVSYSSGTYTQDCNTLPFTSGTAVNTSTAPTIGGVTYTLPNTPAGTPYSLSDTSIGSGSTAIASGMDGWWSTSTGGNNQLGAHEGSQTTGGLISFGGLTSANRAIGLSGTSTSGVTEFAVVLKNTSSTTYNQITVAFTSELWRQQTSAKTLNFAYFVDTTNSTPTFPTSGLTSVSALQSAFATGSSGAVDGTQAANQSAKNATFTISNWAPNQFLWLTWTISSNAGSSQELAIDDFSFSAGIAPPVIGSFSGSLTCAAGQTLILAPSATVSSNQSNFNGGDLTVAISNNGVNNEDQLAIANVGTGPGQIGVNGSNVTFGGTTIGTFSGGTFPASLFVQFNANATPAAVQALLRNVTYTDLVNPVTESIRTVQATINDGSGGPTSNQPTLTITVANNKPDLTIAASVPATGITGSPFNFTLTASNSGTGQATGVQVQFTLPAGLTFNNASGTNGFSFTSNTSGVILLSSGTIAAGGSATITVNVTAPATGTFTAPIGAAVIDPNNTVTEVNEANNSSTSAATINVTSAPQVTNDTYTAPFGGTLTVDAAHGIFANDNGFGHPLQVIVSSTPAHGTLTLNGGDGSFTYTPAPGFTGQDTFTYTASNAVQLWKTNVPPLGVVSGVTITGGGFGSSFCPVPNSPNHDEYYGVTDRGPNVGGPGGIKVEPLTSFVPAIGKFKLLPNGTALLEATITLKDGSGNPYSGRVNTQANTGETITDVNGNVLPPDPNGYDSEGLVALPDGTFWVSDEYGPFITHFDASGKQIGRLSPFDGSLPKELATRVPNKGMEGLTITPDGTTLVGMMQNALQQGDLPPGTDPTKAVIANRIITYRLSDGLTREYLYLMEGFNGVSEITAVTNTTFLVDERDGKFPNTSTIKSLFLIDISGASDVGPTSALIGTSNFTYSADTTSGGGFKVGGKSLELFLNTLSKANATTTLSNAGLTPVAKSLYVDIDNVLKTVDPQFRFFSHDKIEGVAVVSSTKVIVSNDSDFGITDIPGNPTPPYVPTFKSSPSTPTVQDDGEFLLIDTAQLPTAPATATVTINVGTVFGALTPSIAQVGLPYSGSVPLQGSTPPYSSASFSNLPAGLTAGVNGNAITLTGIPTKTGTFSGTVSVKDNSGATYSRTYTLTVQAQLFGAGNLLVSRSVYTGTAATVTVGNPLPGGGTAVADGSYPGVFNNEAQDAAFGVTSPIFIDQVATTNGNVVGTFPISPNLVTTSFPSKSELSLNQSSDGKSVTFMAYVSGANALDISNANTPNHIDPTNPVTLVAQRAVVQFDLQGSVQVTPVNAYSGNNGRGAVLANGAYYLVGNAGNSGAGPTGATLSMLSDDTGVQMINPGSGGDSTVVGLVNGTNGSTTGYQRGFSITQTNPLTGQPYAGAPDKTGKDDNFRGITVFNNTIYVTKGSGGNGINTVYQVGTPGTLPTFASAGSTPITILPGFYTGLAKTDPNVRFPFGIWFANATTLYVADEGDGTIANAASPLNGLQKWILVNGTWQRAYTLQVGLNLGTPYSVPNGPNGEVYPTGINPATGLNWTPATAGLRNISGKINGDGTVTIFAVTSTVSGATDQGADPNQVVAITDNLSFTSASQAAGESFTVLRQAAYGEVLRGVLFTQPSQSQITFDAVAAGDPTNSGATLWTRVQPSIAMNVTAQVATDANFFNIVLTSNGNTDPNQDFTFKANVSGLNAGTRYYYRFVGPFGATSNTGSFKTAPASGSSAPVRFAFSGDCDGRWRPFPSVADIGSQNLDFFEFCGDTMYENASSPATGLVPASPAITAPEVNPTQARTDLRRKYRENINPVNAGGEPSLRNFFAAQANYTLLDNHELSSNIGTGQYQCGGAPQFKPDNGTAAYDTTNSNNDVNLNGPYANQATGFKAMQQAFRNYEPIRERTVSAPGDSRTDGTQQMYTSQQWGKNLMFIHTDDRSYADIRMQKLVNNSKVDDTGPRADNPNRTRLGATQLNWLEQNLLAAQNAGTTWKVVVVSDPIDQIGPVGGSLSGANSSLTITDGSKSWMGGYRAERNALMKFIADNKIKNVVFLATDDHTNRVNELLYFPDPVNAPTVQALVPTCFSIVAGPIGASGPENFTDHSFNTLLGLANGLAQAQKNAGVNPIGLDPAFPGLHDVFREGDPTADSTRGPVDFFSPDTENYCTLEISPNGKTLTVTTLGLNSYAPNLFLEPAATGPVRPILSFQVDANVIPITVAATSGTGIAGTAIPLTITPTLASPFPQTVTVAISGVPTTATLSAGTNAGNGVWNLTSAQLANLTITSSVAGNIPLTVTATDLDSSNFAIGTATATVSVPVTTNPAPIAFNNAVVVLGTTPTNGTLLAFDLDGQPLTYAIVTNGTKGSATITNASTGAFTYTATANGPASDTFTFTASDANGKSNTATVTVTILQQNVTPVANISVSIGTFKAPASIAFDGSGSTGTIVAYQWDFGDGTLGFGAKPTHTYTTAGTYTVSLIVINAAGVSSTPATTTVVIAAATPPPVNTTAFEGKFNKAGKTTFKMSLALPAGTSPGSTVTVKIGTFLATFTGVSDGKVAHSSSGSLKVSGQSLDFTLKADASALFGTPLPTSGTKTVTGSVNTTAFQATPTFTTKGSMTSFK